MSLLQAIKDYMLLFPYLKEDVVMLSDHTAGTEMQYSIVQLPGTRVLDEDLAGNQSCQYAFAFQSIESTLDELQRFENAEFFDKLYNWFVEQNNLEVFPDLEANQVAERIETLGWGYLMQEQTGTGVYQIQCRLLFTQQT